MMDGQQIVGEVAKASGGFLGGLLMAPFNALGGMAKGVFGSLWNGLFATGAIIATKMFATPVYTAILHAVGGKELAEKTAKDVHEKGLPGVFWQSAKEGFGIAALWGGASGMVEGAGKSVGMKGGGVGSTIGTGLVMLTVGTIVLGAISKNGIKSDGDVDPTGNHKPSATPLGTQQAAAPKSKLG